MAIYETVLSVPRSVEATFAFVSDFRNAVRWDPRSYRSEKVTEGPIGVGTRFVITGGLLRGEVVDRLRLPIGIAGMRLPYDVTVFDPPRELVLVGESGLVRYRDHLEFVPDGDGTRLRYHAELVGKGPLARADRLLQERFQRIGDDATRDLPAVVAAAT